MKRNTKKRKRPNKEKPNKTIIKKQMNTHKHTSKDSTIASVQHAPSSTYSPLFSSSSSSCSSSCSYSCCSSSSSPASCVGLSYEIDEAASSAVYKLFGLRIAKNAENGFSDNAAELCSKGDVNFGAFWAASCRLAHETDARPTAAWRDAGVELVGPFEVLEGRGGAEAIGQPSTHWRFFYGKKTKTKRNADVGEQGQTREEEKQKQEEKEQKQEEKEQNQEG
eukprot:GHVT01091206.1.p1 GENE.GHVT01091206.1~~GHVT01091206.1.p1  ORF type:complete len:241 (-),score=64.41 GHVT01091206.1:292-957(-)